MYKKPYRHIFELWKFIVRPFFVYFNRLVFKINDVAYGKKLNVYNTIYLHTRPTSVVKIGDNFTFSSGSNFNQLSRNLKGSIYVDWGGTLEIGDNVGISSCTIWAIDSITIGNRVIIGADTIIMDHNAHSLDYRERQNGDGERKHSPIIIGDDVFIGTRCIILKGVKIGARTIIGAGSVVATDIPSDCIAAGNPCRIIKKIGTK